jgi:hypothetical protein
MLIRISGMARHWFRQDSQDLERGIIRHVPIATNQSSRSYSLVLYSGQCPIHFSGFHSIGRLPGIGANCARAHWRSPCVALVLYLFSYYSLLLGSPGIQISLLINGAQLPVNGNHQIWPLAHLAKSPHSDNLTYKLASGILPTLFAPVLVANLFCRFQGNIRCARTRCPNRKCQFNLRTKKSRRRLLSQLAYETVSLDSDPGL